MKCLVLFFGVFVGVINAQETVWTLEKCLDHAYTNNIQLKQSELQLQLTEVQLKQNKSNTLPTLNAQALHGYNFGQTIDPFTNSFANESVQSNNFNLALSYNVFSGLFNYRNIQVGKFDVEASRQDLEKIKNDISLNICAAYLQILFNKEIFKTKENQLIQSKKQKDRIEQLFLANQLARSNFLEANAQLKLTELELTTAENNLILSKIQLAQLLQLPIDQIEVFDISEPNLNETQIESSFINPGDIYKEATSSLPQIKSAEYRTLSAEKSVESSKSGFLPTLRLNGLIGTGYSGANKVPTNFSVDTVLTQYFTTAPYQQISALDVQPTSFKTKAFGEQLKDNFNQSISLSLTIPIFNGMRNKYNVEQSKIRLEQTKLELEQAKNQLLNDIYQAHAEAIGAYQKYISSQSSVTSLQEAFDATTIKYEQNMITSVEFSDAQTKLDEAISNLISSKYEYIFKMKVLDFYRGVPIKL